MPRSAISFGEALQLHMYTMTSITMHSQEPVLWSCNGDINITNTAAHVLVLRNDRHKIILKKIYRQLMDQYFNLNLLMTCWLECSSDLCNW